jgi:hypothetical protein
MKNISIHDQVIILRTVRLFEALEGDRPRKHSRAVNFGKAYDMAVAEQGDPDDMDAVTLEAAIRCSGIHLEEIYT